jgi:enoyl-[acyl-carrier protein] reductase II
MLELCDGVRRVDFEGDLEAGVTLSGQVAGRIGAIESVAEIIARMVREFHETVESLAKNHLRR